MEERVSSIDVNKKQMAASSANLVVGDVVMLRDENAPRNVWSLALVEQAEPDGQGLVRSVIVRTPGATLRRPINKLVLILPKEEQESVQEK